MGPDNASIAGRLEAFAALLDLAGASNYSVRAYRRAAELIRATPARVADLVQEGRARELRGIGPGIEARLVELVETGDIAELRELEREVAPELVAVGQLLGLSAKRSVELGRASAPRPARGSVRRSVRAGSARCRGSSRRPRRSSSPRWRASVRCPSGGLLSTARGRSRRRSPSRSAEWSPATLAAAGSCASASQSSAAPSRRRPCSTASRRWRRSWSWSSAAPTVRWASPSRASLSSSWSHRGRDSGPSCCARRAPTRTSRSSSRCLTGRTRRPCTAPSSFRSARPSCARSPSAASYRRSSGSSRSAVICTFTRRGRTGRRRCSRWARPHGRSATSTSRSATTHGRCRSCRASTRTTSAARARRSLRQTRRSRRSGSCAGPSATSSTTARSTLPDDVLAELEWVQASVHAGQRQSREQLTRRMTEAARHPAVKCISHPQGRILNHRPPNLVDLDALFEVCRETGTAVETNGLPDRLDLSGDLVREAVAAGVAVVASTDAHSTRGLANMQLAVATARRGWATATDVLNTRPLDDLLEGRD